MFPLRDRLTDVVARRLDLEHGEARVVLRMGLLAAVLFGSHTLAKIMRDALFLAYFGASALPWGYIAVAVVSALIVAIEGRATRRMSRVRAILLSQSIAILLSAAAAFAFPLERHWVSLAFYLWTGSQGMILLSQFWMMALDVWDARRARRLFPLMTGAGLLGGLVAGAYAAWGSHAIGRDAILWTLVALLLVARWMTGRLGSRHGLTQDAVRTESAGSRWQVITRSRFLCFLAVAIALAALVSTLVDFQFKTLIAHAYPDPHDLTAFLGRFYAGLNGLALLVQFGLAGWVLQRVGLGAASALQPALVLSLAVWFVVQPLWWIVVVMRWVQGVVLQTIGKSSTEIYYLALRPPDRNTVKPAIDTLVERWADALVGVCLLIGLNLLGADLRSLALWTAGLALVWMGVIVVLDREYVRSFRDALAARWMTPDVTEDALRSPRTRQALLESLASGDERRMLLALRLCEGARHPRLIEATRSALAHPSAAVRAAAITTLEAMSARDPQGRIAEFLEDPNNAVQRAALSFLIARGSHPVEFVRMAWASEDRSLREILVDVLLDHPGRARGAVALEWIDALIESGVREDMALAARALGVVRAPGATQRLRLLLEHPDGEVRLRAFETAARQPARALLPSLVPALLEPAIAGAARRAIAATGGAAIPALRGLLAGGQGPHAQVEAASVLALLGGARARHELLVLAHQNDPAVRFVGLRNLDRIRARTGSPVVSRDQAHKLFLRELRDYRGHLEPSQRLSDILTPSSPPALRLLAASMAEEASRSLERALRGLATWYDPVPLEGAFRGITGDRRAQAAALEYLHHRLPARVFRPLRALFEESPRTVDSDPARDTVLRGLSSPDAWLRAVALRASRYVPGVDPEVIATADDGSALVRAELDALGVRSA